MSLNLSESFEPQNDSNGEIRWREFDDLLRTKLTQTEIIVEEELIDQDEKD
jgi:hypothetical protein